MWDADRVMSISINFPLEFIISDKLSLNKITLILLNGNAYFY